MNKKITIYELLGLIKDRQAPKKIKYDGIIYYYCDGDLSGNCYFTQPQGFGGDCKSTK